MTAPATLHTEAVAERILPLERGVNFRDLGGYATADGRRVRHGVLYRSGDLSALTEADRAAIAPLGLRTLCDLRTNTERTRHPNRWAQAAGVAYGARDYDDTFGELHSLFAMDFPGVAAARQTMIDGYARAPFDYAPAYRDLFHRLAAGETPLVFHCTAGKDRTGVGAALILEAVGVPRATVLADFALSNHVAQAIAASRGAERDAYIAKLGEEALNAILAAEPGYLQASFDAIDARHGALDRYLDAELGVGPATLDAVRDHLLA